MQIGVTMKNTWSTEGNQGRSTGRRPSRGRRGHSTGNQARAIGLSRGRSRAGNAAWRYSGLIILIYLIKLSIGELIMCIS